MGGVSENLLPSHLNLLQRASLSISTALVSNCSMGLSTFLYVLLFSLRPPHFSTLSNQRIAPQPPDHQEWPPG